MNAATRAVAAETILLKDLAFVMAAAALASLLFRRLRLPGLLGFLVAGFVVGPHNPYFQLLAEEQELQTLADLGVVLLLFSIGLTFNLRELRRVGGVSLVVMVTQGLLMLWLGSELGLLIGWDAQDSLFLGAMVSISSTTIAAKVLSDLNQLQRGSSRIIFGTLILQDLAAVLILVVLAGYARQGDLAVAEVGRVLAEMAVFLLASVLLGILLIPRLVDYVTRHHGNEILVLTILGLVFGTALLSDTVGFHPGLGAFLVGALVAEAKTLPRVESQLRPVTDMFGALFFVTMGTLVDLNVMADYWKPIVALTLLIVVGKFLSGALATFLLGYPGTTGVAVGAGLAQIGEFSFVIAALGRAENFTSEFLLPVVVGASALTALVSPLMLRHSDAWARFLGRLAPASFRTYAQLYGAWMTSKRERRTPAERARVVKARRATLLSGVVLAAILGAGWLLQDRGQAFLESQGLTDPGRTLAYWGVILATMIPILFLFFQSVNRWIGAWEVPEGAVRRGVAPLRRVVQFTFYLLGTILLGLPVIVATGPFLRTPLLVAAWVGMVGSAAVILWASIHRLHARIEANVQALLEDEHLPVQAPQIVRDLMMADISSELRVESLMLEGHTWAAGKRLGELELRSSTGASLILVERDHTRTETPGPETVLLPGDRLTLIGTRDQLASARAVLVRPAPTGPPRAQLRLGRLYVSENSELDGVTLANTGLRNRSGLQVIAVLRDNKAIPNPAGEERLRAGDVLLVLGPQDQIAAATSLVNPRAPGPETDAAPA